MYENSGSSQHSETSRQPKSTEMRLKN